MADNDSDEFEDEDDLEIATNWFDTGCTGSVDLDAEWVTYLASTDPPSTAEGVDLSISDFEENEAGASEQEAQSA
jgi:hypothetical protein